MESIESVHDQLDRFEKVFDGRKQITLDDLREMKSAGISTEQILYFLGKKHGYLFHGSRNDISGELNGGENNCIYASSVPAIAILKAIYLNNAKNLGYPLNLDENNSNLKLTIDEPKESTIGETGWVYLISDKDGFVPDPNSNWQYVKKTEGDGSTSITQRVQIEKDDFKYPVEIRP